MSINTELERHARSLVEQWRKDFVGVMLAMGDLSPKMVAHFAPPARSAVDSHQLVRGVNSTSGCVALFTAAFTWLLR